MTTEEKSICPVCGGNPLDREAQIAGELIEAWSRAHQRQCPWRVAVQITGIVCHLPAAEVERLLAMEYQR